MRYYENDVLEIPEKYKKMSIEQLERRDKFWEIVSKFIPFRKRKKKKLNTDIIFYL